MYWSQSVADAEASIMHSAQLKLHKCVSPRQPLGAVVSPDLGLTKGRHGCSSTCGGPTHPGAGRVVCRGACALAARQRGDTGAGWGERLCQPTFEQLPSSLATSLVCHFINPVLACLQ
jgi:hypothetical protein